MATSDRDAVLENSCFWDPEKCPRIQTGHRRILTRLPVPETLDQLRAAARVFPQVNCYQPPVLWDRADGYQVFDAAGNVWIDFSSCAVMANTGHGNAMIRQALRQHLDGGLLAQFSFPSELRVRLAQRLVRLTPSRFEKVYFWTIGSEAIEAALRVARVWGMRRSPDKWHVLCHEGAFHGWTLGAHQLSGDTARKPWLPSPDAGIHHLPSPRLIGQAAARSDDEWVTLLNRNLDELASSGIGPDRVAAFFVETVRGLEALPLPAAYVRHLRRWADEHNVLLVFDEMQTAFGRTGKLFGFEHYGVEPDLICLGKGLTSSLPLAALLGPAEVLDIVSPGDITTTHAAHPLSCVAALANLDVLEAGRLTEAAARNGAVARQELEQLQTRFPEQIEAVTGWGLLNAVHVRNLRTGAPDPYLARHWTWSCVKHGVMLFFTNHTTIKVSPPLVIPEDALVEGIHAMSDALEAILRL